MPFCSLHTEKRRVCYQNRLWFTTQRTEPCHSGGGFLWNFQMAELTKRLAQIKADKAGNDAIILSNQIDGEILSIGSSAARLFGNIKKLGDTVHASDKKEITDKVETFDAEIASAKTQAGI